MQHSWQQPPNYRQLLPRQHIDTLSQRVASRHGGDHEGALYLQVVQRRAGVINMGRLLQFGLALRRPLSTCMDHVHNLD